MVKKSIIVKRFPMDKPKLWQDVYNVLLKYDVNGLQEQDIHDWTVRDNKTNITVTYRL